MTEKISIHCHVCDAPLESEREIEIQICFECRRYGLLNGCWPDANEIPRSPKSAAIAQEAIHTS